LREPGGGAILPSYGWAHRCVSIYTGANGENEEERDIKTSSQRCVRELRIRRVHLQGRQRHQGCKPVDTGFEYVCDVDDAKIFRKPKENIWVSLVVPRE